MACALWVAGVGVHAQSGANVAVVINDASPASVEIGEYYARKRAVPGSNVIHISAPVQETLTRADYETSVEAPIAKALIERALQDRVLYIVLTKGVPLSITGRTGLRGDAASVDSELTLLYRKMTGRDALVSGTIDNPYYADTRPIREAKPFSHRDQDIYLVTRLDGFTVEDVLALVDRGTAPSPDGRVMLDRRAGPTGIAELWLVEAATRLREQGQDRVDLAETAPADAFSRALIGYFSWGSNDPANRRRRLGLRFGPGAVAATLAGPDARTFAAPPETWQPGGHSGDRGNIFAQSTQSLIADLIRDGVTGVAGNVADPLLASAIRPQVLFPSYLSGFNLAESFYLALPHLSWQGVIVGDPLCRPFDGRVLTDADIEVPADPATGLPGHFAARRVAIAAERNRNAPPEVIPLIVRAEDQLRAGNTTAARGTLERVIELAPNLSEQHLQLAVLDESSGEVEAAERRYRRVLELQPGNPVALNNLAYRLAIGHKQPAEALPLARKAAALAPQDARVLDTFGWIQHLLGNSAEAVRVLTDAVRRAPDNAEIRLHAATALVSVGSFDAAEGHLKEAVRLSPELDSRDDVQALRARLSKRR